MPNSKFPQDTTYDVSRLSCHKLQYIGARCYLLVFLMPKGTTERPRGAGGPGQQAIRCCLCFNNKIKIK